MAEHSREATVAPVPDFYEKMENLPMGNLHEESGEAVGIRGNYEKQVKVRGHHRPLAKNTGRQSRPGCNGFSDFSYGGTRGVRVRCTTIWRNYLKETKTKYAIYLYPSQMEEIKNLMDLANAKSQSEFVSDAIRFYIGYLQQGKNVDYLAPIIAQTIQEEIRSTEKNISQILFKLAVESAMLSELQATQIRVTGEQMEQLRRMCSRIVAENNGIITLEKAIKHQQG